MKKQNLRSIKWIGKVTVLLFIFNFQFSIFNFQWLRAARKPGRMLGKSVGIKLFH